MTSPLGEPVTMKSVHIIRAQTIFDSQIPPLVRTRPNEKKTANPFNPLLSIKIWFSDPQ